MSTDPRESTPHARSPVSRHAAMTRQWMLNRPVQFFLDGLVLCGSLLLAYALRFDFSVPPAVFESILVQLPMVLLVQISCLQIFGVYSFVWRYVGMTELYAFAKAAWWSFLPLLLLRLGLPEAFSQWRVPVSIIIMDVLFAFGGTLGIRVLRRTLYERFEKTSRAQKENGVDAGKPVLLVGAGRAGLLAVKEIVGRGDMGLTIRGYVDDDTEKQGSVIHGVRVVGTTRDLPRLVKELKIDHIIITIARSSRRDIRRIIEICEQIPTRVRIIPGLFEIIDGSVEISRIRDVQIEDLLGREPVELEQAAVAEFLNDKVVMVTGAGGSIGSELCRQVARFDIACLVLVERAEFALFETDRELRQRWPDRRIAPVVADICDAERLEGVFAQHKPTVVIHAAAHKHVPLMELNPTEAIKNNILGTHLLGKLSGENGVETFILISTDKAVRPTSIMGASKRIAELVVQELNQRFSTRYSAVRFGNVMGSAGSVIPIFRRQIFEGGPVTVTHPDMVRYFMTIPEASQLVLQAGAMGQGGEIFVLDMGEPVRILDMAKDMIVLSGLRPFEDVDIVFTGIRPGEKLFEELQTAGENIVNTRHPKIFIGRISGLPSDELKNLLSALRSAVVDGHEIHVSSILDGALPEARLTLSE